MFRSRHRNSPRAGSSCVAIAVAVVGGGLIPAAWGAEQAGNPLRERPLATLAATRERPLFSPTRRPVAELPAPAPIAAVAVAEAPPPRPAEPVPFVLVGTVTGTNMRIAIARIVGTDEVITLPPGASRDGWSVRAVEARRLSVEKDGRVEDVALGDPAEAMAVVAVEAGDRDGGESRGDVASRAHTQQAADAGAWVDAVPILLTR